MDNRLIGKDESNLTEGERRVVRLIKSLVQSDAEWLGRGLIKVMRLRWHRRSIRREHGPQDEEPLPAGPFATTRPDHLGDLLLWVPRRIDSYLIDDLTGGYGYSHSTVDTGEIDQPTGKAIMAEITVGQRVMRKFQDEYGPRAFVRLPLSHIGVDVKQFVECVKSKMGEQYDAWDALTLGEIQDPAREVCSGLVTDCLPPQEVRKIAWARKLSILRAASVSLHSPLNAPKIKAFISPNGFAEYYGAPKGRKLPGPDTLLEPKPINATTGEVAKAAVGRHGWKLITGLLAVVLIALNRRRLR